MLPYMNKKQTDIGTWFWNNIIQHPLTITDLRLVQHIQPPWNLKDFFCIKTRHRKPLHIAIMLLIFSRWVQHCASWLEIRYYLSTQFNYYFTSSSFMTSTLDNKSFTIQICTKETNHWKYWTCLNGYSIHHSITKIDIHSNNKSSVPRQSEGQALVQVCNW